MAWCYQATSHCLSQCWPRSILPHGITGTQHISTLKPEQNTWHFADYFKCISVSIICCISSANSVKTEVTGQYLNQWWPTAQTYVYLWGKKISKEINSVSPWDKIYCHCKLRLEHQIGAKDLVEYRDSHSGDKMILQPSYLHNRITYTGKRTCLYWIRAMAVNHHADFPVA